MRRTLSSRRTTREAEDVVTELDIPPETRGTFSLVEKSLQKKKNRRDPTESMITHPEGQDVGPDLRIKTSKSPGKGTDMSENQKISMALEAGETVIKKGLVVKKKYKGLLPSVRVLILTDGVRLLMLDNQTFKVKGTVDLPRSPILRSSCWSPRSSSSGRGTRRRTG